MGKTCTKCFEEKPLEEFPNEAKRKDGKYPWCKQCLSDHRKTRYKKVPRKVWITEKVCSKCKEWKSREEFRLYKGSTLHYKCISCEDKEATLAENEESECSYCGQVKHNSLFYKSRIKKTSKQCKECHKNYNQQPDIKLRRRDQSLRKVFGITLEDYKNLLEQQGYLCPICLEPFEQDNYSYPVDHAHSGPNAGAIRAILHDACNRFVMWKHTDPEVLRRAADLIESPLTDWFVPEEYIKGPKKNRRKRTNVPTKRSIRRSSG